MNRQRLGLAWVLSMVAGASIGCGTSSSSPGEEDGGAMLDGASGTTPDAPATADGAASADGTSAATDGAASFDGTSATTDGAAPADGAAATDGGLPGVDASDATTSSGDATVMDATNPPGDATVAMGDAPSADARPGDATISGDASEAGSSAHDAGTEAAASADGGCTVAPGSTIGVLTDPITTTTITPPNPPGITFMDTDKNLVNAHGGGIIEVCGTFYLHGEYFLSTTTNNDFNGFSMYSSKDMATWKNEGIILPQQASGQLGPNRKGERPHIIQCPSTKEFVLYAHSADVTYEVDKEVVYATSPTVNGTYSFKGSLTNSSGTIAAHSDMSALTDGNNAYVVTESGWVYTLASDCHSWTTAKQYPAVNGTTGGSEAPTVFKAGSTYYWIGSDKTGWQANDDFYSTAPAITGPWTYQGNVAPVGSLTWMTQTTWVMPIAGTQGTVYMYWGDHWSGQNSGDPGQHNYETTYVFQPLVLKGTAISMPTYQISWKLDVGAGTWSAN